MRAILVGNLRTGMELVTKDDGTLWEDGDNNYNEAVDSLTEKFLYHDNSVMEIRSCTVTDKLDEE